MDTKTTEFYPFYDPYRGGDMFGYGSKIGISVSFGAFYMLLQYFVMPDKLAFFQQHCWILGAIISTSMLALYIATDLFRRSLVTMNEFEGDNQVSSQVVNTWLNNKSYLTAGLLFATLNTTVGHLLGVPGAFHTTPLSLTSMYVGFFMAGFSAGMGLLAIMSVIVLYLKFAPNLQHSLDPNNPDGTGGIRKLGDSLWFFAMLIFCVGVLVSIYMFGVQWEFMYKGYVRTIFLTWIALPYLFAISIVLIPGLAVRRQVSNYKSFRANQLKQEKAQLYSSYKEFDPVDDDEIIENKKQLNEKIEDVQDQLQNLKKMRNSHIDGKDKS